LGRIVQKRIVRKLELEALLSRVEQHPAPRSDLEQYTIPVNVAGKMLYVAAYVGGDIEDKSVLDLGCGTGRLALGAAYLGAASVVGVDVDKVSIEVAAENSRRVGLEGKVSWVVADVAAVCGRFDTVLQNPPFGVQRAGADRRFLEKALKVGTVVYSLHKRPKAGSKLLERLRYDQSEFETVAPSPFLRRFVEDRGRKILGVYAVLMSVPRMFDFHSERKHEFVADLYVIGG
jgi:putative methylase